MHRETGLSDGMLAAVRWVDTAGAAPLSGVQAELMEALKLFDPEWGQYLGWGKYLGGSDGGGGSNDSRGGGSDEQQWGLGVDTDDEAVAVAGANVPGVALPDAPLAAGGGGSMPGGDGGGGGSSSDGGGGSNGGGYYDGTDGGGSGCGDGSAGGCGGAEGVDGGGDGNNDRRQQRWQGLLCYRGGL